jgi:drug/metabolite transporter (DMT)-like permease
MTLLGQRLRSDMLLLLAALLWGSAFVPQRLATANLGTFLFNGFRFLLGAMILLPWVRPLRWPVRSFYGWASLAGGLLVAAAACQQAGLAHTTAANAGFLTGLYVVMVPVVLLVGWRQSVAPRVWFAAVLAVVGVFLLSANRQFQIGYGDVWEVVGAVFWALHIVIVGRAVSRIDVLLFSVGQYLIAGLLSTLLGLVMEATTLPGVADCWWAIVYIAVFSVAAGYTLQAKGQKHAPAADAAILLSMEAVSAALFGYILLGESLTTRQLGGCVLIMAAIVIVSIPRRTRTPRGREQFQDELAGRSVAEIRIGPGV